LDSKNPRLGRETSSRAPREIIQYLFENDKALEEAGSIARHGFFPNEPLLAIWEDGRVVVVEGNRRLAALKALREPGLLEGSLGRQVERLSRQITDLSVIAAVPVIIAPSRKSTDRLIAARHIGTPVLSWRAENRASFILDKLEEGYDNDELRDILGFKLADIQKARQTRAIADMARSLNLPDELKAKLDNPKANIFTTLERVFDSSVGREYLMVEPDPDHGLRGTTTKNEFLRGFTKLVTDVAIQKATSRTLNTNDQIKEYFNSWDKADRPIKKRGKFVPSELIKGKSVASVIGDKKSAISVKKIKQENIYVLPRNLKIRFGNDRLIDIRKELVRLKRKDFPNAGVVMLRVFFELAVKDFLNRTGELKQIIERIESKEGKVPYGVPTLKQLVPEINRVAKLRLTPYEATLVGKAVRYDPEAPFTISDLHAFVHSTDIPGERDIQTFWSRTEPLFRMMLERDPKE
jgi:hypothetical protein